MFVYELQFKFNKLIICNYIVYLIFVYYEN